MRGRIPEPTALKLLKGNPGRRPLNENEPKPRPMAPKKPAWLRGKAGRIWREYSPKLERLGLLTELDGLAFAALCAVQADYLHYRAEIEKAPDVVQMGSRGRRVPIPEVKMADAAHRQALSLMREFGLTPLSRGRMAVAMNNQEDDFDDFFE